MLYILISIIFYITVMELRSTETLRYYTKNDQYNNLTQSIQ